MTDEMYDENQERDPFEDLILEFTESRKKIYGMLEELESISSSVKELFPEKFDARFRLVFQERVKAVTELFKACLDMRKEISKSIKDEIEIRRKVGPNDSIDNIEDLLNIASMADKIEEFQNTISKSKKKSKKVVEEIE